MLANYQHSEDDDTGGHRTRYLNGSLPVSVVIANLLKTDNGTI